MNRAARHKGTPVQIPVEIFPMIPGFLHRRYEEAKLLKDLLGKNDLVAISHLAHKLKGHGTAYGFDVISIIGKEMEAAAKGNDASTVEGLVEEYQTSVAFYLDNLKKGELF